MPPRAFDFRQQGAQRDHPLVFETIVWPIDARDIGGQQSLDSRMLLPPHVGSAARASMTGLGNLALLCGFHYRLVHEGGWEVARDRDRRLIFVGPDGGVRGLGSPRLRDDLRRRLCGEGAAPAPPLLDTG